MFCGVLVVRARFAATYSRSRGVGKRVPVLPRALPPGTCLADVFIWIAALYEHIALPIRLKN